MKSKNILRNKVKDLKIELGGKCIKCNFNDLFFLEFNHIDPLKKNIQVTRSAPDSWIKEKDNLELLCGRCHRIKTEI
jgi:5-methylcytosine-specific restriction endonuclease McrA